MRFPGSEGSDSSGSTSGYPGILDMLQSAFDDDSDVQDVTLTSEPRILTFFFLTQRPNNRSFFED